MKRVSDVDLRLLRVFVAVVEARGFAAAESDLNLSTSTISVHMSNLEARLGIHLCERGRGGFKLTEAGEVVYQEARAMLHALDDFAGRLASAKSLLSGRLVVGMVDGLVTHPTFPISEAVRRFNEAEHEVEIELVVGARQVLEHDVVEGRLHAAFGPSVRQVSGLDFTPLYRERHALYCGRGHPLFDAPPRLAKRSDLSAFPAVVRLYHRDFDVERLGVVREEAVVNNMEAMLALLLSGGYIGYLPDHYAAPWVARGLLSAIRRPDAAYESEHAIITKKAGHESLALSRFIGIVKELCT